jgi:asparagine synthase (glutamine-hydrolysing)
LIESVESRFISDVEVGAFLSGGIDSSLVASIAKIELGRNVNTFTIGFDQENYDESSYAAAVAKELKLPNHIFIMTQNDVLETIKQLPHVYDEPFCDSSQVPTLFLSKHVSGMVKVALTGDGGDELMFGYPRYADFESKIAKFRKIHNFFSQKATTDKVQKSKAITGLKWLVTGDPLYLYDYTISRARNLSKFFLLNKLSEVENHTIVNSSCFNGSNSGYMISRNIDLASYLPDELMVKTDRASMFYGLELRTPFLNQLLFNYIDETSSETNMNIDANKIKLKNVLAKYIPKELFERPKKGFSIPVDMYLRKYLKEDVQNEMFDKPFIDAQALFDSNYLSEECKNYFSLKDNDDYFIWAFYNFQKWYRNNLTQWY